LIVRCSLTVQGRHGDGPVRGGRSDRQPYDGASVALREHVENLAIWEQGPDTSARRCASDTVDAMVRYLYLTRGRLTAEVRQVDDATAARANGLLARMREDRGGDLPNRDRP
jgi:hypothetical protein